MIRISADDLHPDVRSDIAKLPKLPFAHRPLIPVARFIYNMAAGRRPALDGVTVSTEIIGGQSIRITRPQKEGSGAAVLWFFGGGHLAGKPAHLDGLGSYIALKTGATFIAADYRLAPKHPFPADLDDAFAAWQWLTENATSVGASTDKLAIGGNSAGGGLAAGLAQRILDEGRVQPKAQILFYPMLDDRTAANEELDNAGHFVWDNKANRSAWSAYLSPRKPGDSSLPAYAAPARRRDLSGLPPAWIGRCELDLFSFEDEAYASRLEAAGIHCQLESVAGVPHAFEALCPSVEIAQRFVDSAVDFLGGQLGAS